MGNVITLKGTVPTSSNLPKFSDLYPNLIEPNKIIANDTLQRSPSVDLTDASIDGNWVQLTGGFTVQSDGVGADADVATIATIDSGSADLQSEVVNDWSANLMGITFRVQDSDNRLEYIQGTTTTVLRKVVAGSATAISPGVALQGGGAAVPHKLKVVVSGDNVKCYDNDVLTFDETVADFNTETAHGIYSDRLANRQSNFILATV